MPKHPSSKQGFKVPYDPKQARGRKKGVLTLHKEIAKANRKGRRLMKAGQV